LGSERDAVRNPSEAYRPGLDRESHRRRSEDELQRYPDLARKATPALEWPPAQERSMG
jgi:hypothetical protein